MSKSPVNAKRRLLKTVVCPHCWTSFPPEDVLWIAESPALVGDMKLGETEHERFLPTEFDLRGFALDANGYSCREFACPHCHLHIPAASLEASTIFMSIVGAPSSGKSYYLASSTWRLRKILPKKFKVDFTDAEPEMNRRLQEYESLQFLSEEDRIVRIDKTEEQGDLYNSVQYDDQTVVYPQPFIFLASPARDHPNRSKASSLSKTVCLYDNAGESYLPTRDSDSSSSPVTRHLGRCGCLFFLFDPTQDARFRAACRVVSNDPQLDEGDRNDEFRRSPIRQEAVFSEMTRRIRATRGMYMNDRFKEPLVVVVTKLDVWQNLLPSNEFRKDPVSTAYYEGTVYSYLRVDRVKAVSERLRSLLMKRTPDFVSSAESFAEEVIYIPVSATGVSPEIDPTTGRSGFRVKNINPIWVDVPMLYALSRLTNGVVPAHSADVGTAIDRRRE
ncbi:MAG: hypothetical protein II596_12940 [Thermoguttaceae bacterium]|nr:hypothetical protein [Thermoguttaceae bacterium]